MAKDFQHSSYQAAREALKVARRDASKALSDDFPDAMVDSIVPAISQALKLNFEAARITSQMQQNHSEEKAKEELKRRCPGYSEATYRAAVMDAFVDSIR